MELRVQAPARHMAEGGGHQGGRPGPCLAAPGLEEVAFDEIQGRPHRLVVGAEHRPVPPEQALQGNRLRGRQRQVDPGPVLVGAVAYAPQAGVGAGDVSLEDGVEPVRLHVPVEPEGGGAPAVPPAGFPVLGVAFRVISLLLEIVHRGGGGGDAGDGGDHGIIMPCRRGRIKNEEGLSEAIGNNRKQFEQNGNDRGNREAWIPGIARDPGKLPRRHN